MNLKDSEEIYLGKKVKEKEGGRGKNKTFRNMGGIRKFDNSTVGPKRDEEA